MNNSLSIKNYSILECVRTKCYYIYCWLNPHSLPPYPKRYTKYYFYIFYYQKKLFRLICQYVLPFNEKKSCASCYFAVEKGVELVLPQIYFVQILPSPSQSLLRHSFTTISIVPKVLL